MAWGEAHLIAGTSIYGLAHLISASKHAANRTDGGKPVSVKPGAAILIPAAILAAMTHWPLDAVNSGPTLIYHDTGETWWTVASLIILRVIIWLCLIWIFIKYPRALICAFSAWLILDWEWIIRPGTGFGFHYYRMWPHWLITQWGLITWAVAFGLFLSMVLQGSMLKDFRKVASLAVADGLSLWIRVRGSTSRALRGLATLAIYFGLFLWMTFWMIVQRPI